MTRQNKKYKMIPEWVANTPFPPNKKKPCKVTEDMYVSFLYGFEGKQVENQVFVSTDKIFMAQWTLPPGSYYQPAGLHLYGDECYYLVAGEAVGFNPETGESFVFRAGDAMLIPQGTRHQVYNMTSKTIVAIACVAPYIWIDDSMGTFIPEVIHPRFYKGIGERTQGKVPPAYRLPRIKRSVDSLGNWPAPGPELRKAKQLIIIRAEDQLGLVHGKEKHVLFSFVVSNDYMHLAILKIPVLGLSEFESHEGDEVINVLEGKLCVRMLSSEDERRDNATYPHIRLNTGEKMLIPAGIQHQYLNFTDDVVSTYVAIAPKL